jgi:sentrin-specific protease 1
MEKVFFPINISDSHWVLAVALIQQKRIVFRDALGHSGRKYTDAVKQYLADEMREKRDVSHAETQAQLEAWDVQPLPPDGSPQQQNKFDCGMFVCMYADYLIQDLPEQFNQEHMPMLRHKIAHCVLEGSLMYTV